MRTRRTVYCEAGFLQQLSLDQVPQRPLTENFLLKSDLVVDSLNGFKRLAVSNVNSPMFRLMKRHQAGHFISERADFVQGGIKTSRFTDENLNAVYLMAAGSRQECERAADHYGIVSLSQDLYNDFYLNATEGRALPRDANDWEWLQSLNENNPPVKACNAMIVIDPYLLQDGRNRQGEVSRPYTQKIDENLDPILKHILPRSLNENIEFHIDFYVGSEPSWTHDDWDERYNYLCDVIEDVRRDLEYSLAIYGVRPNEFHDRIIITNNVSIKSSAGFDIFPRSRRAKPIEVEINFPFIQTMHRSLDSYVLQQLETAKMVHDQRLPERMSQRVGDTSRLNRIIKYYMG